MEILDTLKQGNREPPGQSQRAPGQSRNPLGGILGIPCTESGALGLGWGEIWEPNGELQWGKHLIV